MSSRRHSTPSRKGLPDDVSVVRKKNPHLRLAIPLNLADADADASGRTWLELHNLSSTHSLSYKVQCVLELVDHLTVSPHKDSLPPGTSRTIAFQVISSPRRGFPASIRFLLISHMLSESESGDLPRDYAHVNKFSGRVERTSRADLDLGLTLTFEKRRLGNKTFASSPTPPLFTLPAFNAPLGGVSAGGDNPFDFNRTFDTDISTASTCFGNATMLDGEGRTMMTSTMMPPPPAPAFPLGASAPSFAEFIAPAPPPFFVEEDSPAAPRHFYFYAGVAAATVLNLAGVLAYALYQWPNLWDFVAGVLNALLVDQDDLGWSDDSGDGSVVWEDLRFWVSILGHAFWVCASVGLFFGLLRGRRGALYPWMLVTLFSHLTTTVIMYDLWASYPALTCGGLASPLTVGVATLALGVAAMALVWYEARTW